MIERELVRYVEEHREVLIGMVRDLVRIPSENTPPIGSEAGCQDYCAARLCEWGYETEVYGLGDVAGLEEHPLYWPGRDYRTGRTWRGNGAGAAGGDRCSYPGILTRCRPGHWLGRGIRLGRRWKGTGCMGAGRTI